MDNSQLMVVGLTASLLGNVTLGRWVLRYRKITRDLAAQNGREQTLAIRSASHTAALETLNADLDEKISIQRVEIDALRARLNTIKRITSGAMLRDPKTGKMSGRADW